MTELPTSTNAQKESRLERDRVLRQILQPNQRAWLVEEKLLSHGPTWQISIVRQGLQGVWFRQRYNFDIPSGVLFFQGESPLNEVEVAQAHRTGTPLA